MKGLLPARSKKPFIVFIIIVILVGLFIFLFKEDFTPLVEVEYGITFSKKYAIDLELDWQTTYLAMINDLKVDNIRLIAYWDDIEAVQDEFDFSDLDWQFSQLAGKDVDVILVIGRRAPRWPECHDPSWVPGLAPLSAQQQQLEYIRATVERYRGNDAIKSWQVENEPLFAWFGNCPKPSKDFLREEVALVKSLDNRPIIVTAPGELSHWQGAGSIADTLGITMYRIVWNKYLGFYDYFFIPASTYRHRADLTLYLQKSLEGVIITELQMEPWTMDKRMIELTLEEQRRSFDVERFRDNIEYAKRAGFTEIYVWGPEYWYWLAQQGHPELWEEGKKLWQ